MKMANALSPLQARWTAASPRERHLTGSAATLVGLALVWWLLVAPPLRTLTHSQAEQRKLEVQGQKMQGLKAEAAALQALPKITRDDALRALDAAIKQHLSASAQMNVIGDSATVTLRSTPANALAEWLPQVRINARAIPSEARLQRSNSNPAGQAVWSGSIVLRLPQQ